MCQNNNKIPGSNTIKIVRQPASERDIQELNLNPGDSVIYLQRLLSADGEPVMVEHNYFPDRFSLLLEADLSDTSLYAFLQSNYGIHLGRAYKSIQIATPHELEAELLNISMNTPMMVIREIIYEQNTGEPIHRTKQYLLGDRFKYVIPKD